MVRSCSGLFIALGDGGGRYKIMKIFELGGYGRRHDNGGKYGLGSDGGYSGVLSSTATAIRPRVTVILLGVLVVVLGLVVGGGSAAGSSGVGGDRSVAVTDLADTVVIKNFAFAPTSLAVAPATKITVVNQDRAPHTVTAQDNSFDTGIIAAGQRGEITAPSSLGTYPYICIIHPSMTGALIVK